MQGSLVCPRCSTSNIALGSPGCPSCGVQFAPTTSQATPVFEPLGSAVAAMPGAPVTVLTYAHIGHRILAGIIDLLILGVPFWILFGFDYGGDGYFEYHAIDYVELAIGAVYFVALMASAGESTLGMRVLKMRILRDETYEPISAARALGWYAASIISAVTIVGYLFIAFTRKKQALHDLIAGTVFVRDTN